MNANILSIFITGLIAVFFFTGLSFQVDEIVEKNTLLNAESKTILLDIKSDTNKSLAVSNYKLEEVDPDVTSGSGIEDFSREFRESKATVTNQIDTITSISSVPSIIVKSIGIQQDEQVTAYLAMTGFLLAIMIGIASYVAWKTGEVKNR